MLFKSKQTSFIITFCTNCTHFVWHILYTFVDLTWLYLFVWHTVLYIRKYMSSEKVKTEDQSTIQFSSQKLNTCVFCLFWLGGNDCWDLITCTDQNKQLCYQFQRSDVKKKKIYIKEWQHLIISCKISSIYTKCTLMLQAKPRCNWRSYNRSKLFICVEYLQIFQSHMGLEN